MRRLHTDAVGTEVARHLYTDLVGHLDAVVLHDAADVDISVGGEHGGKLHDELLHLCAHHLAALGSHLALTTFGFLAQQVEAVQNVASQLGQFALFVGFGKDGVRFLVILGIQQIMACGTAIVIDVKRLFASRHRCLSLSLYGDRDQHGQNGQQTSHS